MEDVLRRRARQLAEIPQAAGGGTEVEVLRFRLGREEYAVDLRLLWAVQRAHGLTPVPCTPPHVAGILNVRGEIVTVLGLAVALGLEATMAPAEDSPVLLVELSRARVALLVDEVLGVEQVALASLDRALSGSDLTRGIAGARVVYLDLDQLGASGRFDVSEEVV